MQILENHDLTPLNSFRLRSCARYFCAVTTEDELFEALAFAKQKGLGCLVLGGGTNVVLDEQLDNLVIHIDMQGFYVTGCNVIAAAGQNWHELVLATLAVNLFGLENLALIPGSVGAAPIQNIGAYGSELAGFVDSVVAVHRHDVVKQRFSVADCEFGYRESIFKQRESENWVICEVALTLRDQAELQLSYPGIQEMLAELSLAADAQGVAEAVMALRRRKLPAPESEPNVGSFFKNPVVDEQTSQQLVSDYPDIPVYKSSGPGATLTKLSAAWLIERAGLKGFRLGSVGVSDQHALVLTNRDFATARDVKALSDYICDRVDQRFGIRLEIEPRLYPSHN